ncbi:cyclase family protein [Chloroflexota bacterium]
MKLVDLSTPYDSNYSCAMPPYPHGYTWEGEEYRFTWPYTAQRDGFFVTNIHISTHTGTHMDAPMHVFKREDKEGMYYLGDIPLDRLYGDTVCWEIPRGELEPITADDLEKANEKLPIKEDEFLLIYTHWGHKYFTVNANYMFYKSPGLNLDGAKWCVEKKIRGYGQDTIGTQWRGEIFLQTEDKWKTGEKEHAEPVHKMMLGNDIILFEHLWNLDKIANRRVKCGFFPLPLQDREASPIRAVAFLDE